MKLISSRPSAHAVRIQKLLDAGVPSKKISQVLKTLHDEHVALTRARHSRSHCKSGGRASKAKGRSAVVLVKRLLDTVFSFDPDEIQVKATSQGGCDLHLSPTAQRKFPFGIEVKNAEALNIWSALAQSEINAQKKKQDPILFFKRSGTKLYVALNAEIFARVLAWIPVLPKGRISK